MEKLTLKGKVAIVTGGANGIRRAISEVFAEEGAWVLIADIDEQAGQATASLIRGTGGEAVFCRADVTSEQEAARASVAYTTVKAGLLGFTRSVAYDYGKHGIRVNAICPGPIRTRISPEPGEELYRIQVSKTFLERVGQPREVAYAALFLASDYASYITGAVLPVDGGWTAM